MPEEIDRAMEVLLGRMENEDNKHPVVSVDFIQLTVRPLEGGEYDLEMYTTANGIHIEVEGRELQIHNDENGLDIFLDWNKEEVKGIEDDHIQ